MKLLSGQLPQKREWSDMTTSTLARKRMMTAMSGDLSAFGLDFSPIQIYEDGKPLDMRMLALFPELRGATSPRGYHTEGDIVTQTADGVDLNDMWADYQATLEIFNQRRQALIDILTFPVTQLIENVPQVGETEFEEASEFGVPKSARVEVNYFQLAYDFRDYDAATRYTWKFLRDADVRQVDAVHQAMLNADRRLIFRKVMEALFDNRNRNADIRGQNYTVFALYNADGTVPPEYKGTTFAGTHDHYLVSGAADIDSDDIEDLNTLIAEHGYGTEQGTTFVAFVNKAEMTEIRKFRAGEVNNNGVTANFDFIPAANQPTLIVPNEAGLLGARPPNTWNGLPVTGSYMNILFIEEDYIPAGYVLMFGSGGSGDLQNPVGLREHANAAYRGLRLLPGNQQRYPLVDSYYARGFGTGIRQRAGAAILMVGTGAYVIPPQYERGGGLS